MSWIAQSLGLFYSAAALLALLTLRSAWSAKRGNRQVAAPAFHERIWLGFTLLSICLYGAAGIALLVKSHAAVWLLGCGLLAQGCFYGLIWLSGKAQLGGGDERGRKIWSAAMVSTAVFAFSTYAARQGVLS
ncbi:MAG: hypothetical protein ACFCUR_06320 [Rhodomicrobiaceae bacterium]